MLHKCKIGFVSVIWSASVYRRVHGALAYADSHQNISMREFHLDVGFGSSSNSPATVNELEKWNPDGLLCLLEPFQMERLQQLTRARPIVNMFASEPGPRMAVVLGDLSNVIHTVVRHFRHQGLRSIAMIFLEESHKNYKIMVNCFNRIVHPDDLARSTFFFPVPLELMDNPNSSVKPVPRRLSEWLRQLPRPTGLFCNSLGGGGYLIRVCQAIGLSVPNDIRVVGVDDTDVSLMHTPTLTSAMVNDGLITFEAMNVLDQMIMGGAVPKEKIRVGGTDLHVRESTGQVRGEICNLAAALEYIDQHACSGLSVNELFKQTQNVSLPTFRKYFQLATGRTPGKAIIMRQIEMARSLLAKTELSITTVAEQSGFGGSSDFSRRFRAVEGKTPAAYRKQQRLLLAK